MFQQCVRRRRGFHDRPIGRDIAAQHLQPGRRAQRIIQRADHILVVAFSPFGIGKDIPAHDGLRGPQLVAQMGQHHGHPARIAEIFHQIFTRGHAVDQQRDIRPKLEIIERQVDADAARDGQQMDHGIGRPADSGIGQNGVLDRGTGNDLRQLDIFLDHLDDALAGQMRQRHAARINGRQRGVGGQRHPHRLYHACHRRGRAHRHTHALGPAHAGFSGHEILQGHLARAHIFRELPHIRARADVLALPLAVQHRAGADNDRRQIDACRAHQLTRRGLVTAAQQNHPIDTIGADAFFDVHRQQVAKQHGGRLHLGLAKAHHRKFDRKAPCLPHAALHPFGQIAQAGIARGQFGPCIADTDNGAAIKGVVGKALIFHPAAVNEPVPIILAVPSAVAFLFCHSRVPSMTHMRSGNDHGRVTPWFMRYWPDSTRSRVLSAASPRDSATASSRFASVIR